MSQGVSLRDSAPGGFLDDVDATVVKAITGEYQYPGGTTVNAMIIDFRTDDGQEHQEAYSSGAAVATPDGTGFTSTPKDSSKAKRFIMKAIELGVEVDNTVRIFEGLRFHLKREVLPKLRTDAADAKDKTVLLPVTLLKAAAKPAARPTARPAVAKAAIAAAAPATSAAPAVSATSNSSTSNGNIEKDAIIAVQAVLRAGDQGGIAISKLATSVMVALAKGDVNGTPLPYGKHPEFRAASKLVTAEWLEANMEVGSWIVDGSSVMLMPS